MGEQSRTQEFGMTAPLEKEELRNIGSMNNLPQSDGPSGMHSPQATGDWQGVVGGLLDKSTTLKVREVKMRLRKWSTINLISAMSGLAISIYTNELHYKECNVCTKILITKIINGLITLILVFGVWRFNNLELDFLKIKKAVPRATQLLMSPLAYRVVIEVMLCSCHPPLGSGEKMVKVESLGHVLEYHVDSGWTALCFLRIYHVLRYVHLHTFSKPSEDAIMRLYKVDRSATLTIKMWLSISPFTTLALASVLNVLIFGYLVRISEIPGPTGWGTENNFHNNFWETLWLVVTTLSTVGYGDAYPTTHPGRLFCTLSFIVGNITIAVMIAVITEYLKCSPSEQRVVDMKISSKFKLRLTNVAGDIIVSSCKLFLYRIKLRKMIQRGETEFEFESTFKKTLKSIEELESWNRVLISGQRKLRAEYVDLMRSRERGHDVMLGMLTRLIRDTATTLGVMNTLPEYMEEQLKYYGYYPPVAYPDSYMRKSPSPVLAGKASGISLFSKESSAASGITKEDSEGSTSIQTSQPRTEPSLAATVPEASKDAAGLQSAFSGEMSLEQQPTGVSFGPGRNYLDDEEEEEEEANKDNELSRDELSKRFVEMRQRLQTTENLLLGTKRELDNKIIKLVSTEEKLKATELRLTQTVEAYAVAEAVAIEAHERTALVEHRVKSVETTVKEVVGILDSMRKHVNSVLGPNLMQKIQMVKTIGQIHPVSFNPEAGSTDVEHRGLYLPPDYDNLADDQTDYEDERTDTDYDSRPQSAYYSEYTSEYTDDPEARDDMSNVL
ncbi:hypothetical protein CYMTET_10610 [Cymbomonas tetramitiformis]|uniref:Potassium channel domain-containing protein n=1 Tax=Cymbomonas tetramitiformis TaxID=36881 RepID=A0AAE0LEB1_9CHLO|nr:hypothetical protein CYMTET_10610 [Cymbomonas tetramitiformis]